MSFSSDVKKEIITQSKGKAKDVSVEKSMVSAFVRTSGTLGVQGGVPTFFLVSETENVIEYFLSVFYRLFSVELTVSGANMNKMSGRDKLVFQCPLQHAEKITAALGLLKRDKTQFKEGIASSLVKTDAQKIAYIKGAFLGGGSCVLPVGKNAGYHLEIVFNERKTAKDFCLLLAEFEVIAKVIERKETFVVYIKSKELISDFLSVLGTNHSLEKLVAFLEKRDEANNDNRAKNCFSGNADKSAIAAVKQVVAIQKIYEKTHYKHLSEELTALAKARLKNPSMTMQELANHLDISKSCLNHRLRKLMQIAEEL